MQPNSLTIRLRSTAGALGPLFFFLLISLAAVPAAWGQSATTGAISGAVRDASGAVVPGATVAATSAATNQKTDTTSDLNGRYVVGHLQPGTYLLEVSATGFAQFRQENVTVEVGRSTPIDVQLAVAAQSTTVVATAEAPVITTDRPDFSTNINTDFITNLPINGRRWSAFALGSPGTVPDGSFGLVSYRGISGLLNNNTVDGGDNNQAFFSEEKGRTRISYSISEDAIQEFQVNTSNFSAQYGRAAGGVVNAVTKSGTNDIHGDAFWYYRDSDLGATNPFAFQTVRVNGVFQSVPVNPPDRRHQFGGDIGGPIVKDKLFFFLSADQQLRNFPGVAQPSNPSAFFAPLGSSELSELSTITGGAVTPAQAAAGLNLLDSLTGTVPRTGDELVLFPKIDWQINPSNRFSAEWNRMRWSSPAGIQTGAVVNRGIESFGDDFVKDDTVIGRLASTIGPTITNEFLFEYGRDFEYEFGQPSIAGEPVAPQTGVSPQIGISGSASFTFGEPNFLPRPAFPNENRYQFADTLTWSRGSHLLKFGADINRVHDLEQNLFEQDGAYSYTDRVHYLADWVAATNHFATPACQGSGCYSSFAQGLGPLGFEFTTWDLGLFANDDWRIHPKLTLTLGLRYDFERMPNPQIPNSLLPGTNQFSSDKNDLGPRVGFAWDLTGKGTTVLRGGYGIYYGRIINSTIFNAIADVGSADSQFTLSFLPADSGAPLYPNIIPSLSGTPKSALAVVQFAPDTQNPLIHEFDLVFEHEIARNTALSVSYLGSLGRNLPIFLDTNLSAPTASVTYTVSGGQFDGKSFTVPVYTKPRPNPNFGAITDISYTVNSHYNAVVFQVNRRMTAGLQAQAFYSYSQAFDDGQSSTTFTTTNNVFDPRNLSLESGRSIFDVRHHFSALIVWAPEFYKGDNSFARMWLNGFTVSPSVGVSSGAPVTGTLGFVNAPSCLVSTKPCPANETPVTFNINGAGGTNRPPWLPRDAFQMPRVADVDLEMGKAFMFRERWNFRIFADAFNLFNHVNPTGVNNTLYNSGGCSSPTTCTLKLNPTFLTPTSSSSTLGGPGQRQIQIGAKLTW